MTHINSLIYMELAHLSGVSVRIKRAGLVLLEKLTLIHVNQASVASLCYSIYGLCFPLLLFLRLSFKANNVKRVDLILFPH